MRKALLAAMVSLALSGTRTASAQKCGQGLEVPASTPREAIAKLIVDALFDDIALTDAQQSKAVEIVLTRLKDADKLDARSPDYRKGLAPLIAKQNADLLALMTNEPDKAKLTTCFKLMAGPPRGGGGGSA
jgi:hypothetical protein